jgi:small-conductance mechanosensitive channel
VAGAVVAVAGVWSGPALGQDVPAPTSPEAQVVGAVDLDVPRAPVVIDGEPLFTLRGISAYPAIERAAAVEGRIRALANESATGAPLLTLDDQPSATWIVANGQRLLAVTDVDAAMESLDRRELAEVYRLKISDAVAGYRAARQPGVLARHTGFAAGATVLLLVAAYASRRIVRGVDARLKGRYQIPDVAIQAVQLVQAKQLWRILSGALNLVWIVTVFVMAVIYLRYVLGLFPWSRSMADQVFAFATDPLRSMALGFIGFIPNLMFLVVLFLVVRYLLKVVRAFFDGVETGSVEIPNFDREWAVPTYKLARLLIIVCAVVVAYPYVPGSNTDAFKGISIFIGIVFSLGSSSVIGNIVSGFSMTYRRTFRVGDVVRIGEHTGTVQEMRLLVTHLLTPKNEEVIVPNSAILTSEVVNYSSLAKTKGLILHTTVGIGYQTPWRQVEAMLIEAAARTPGLWRTPQPFVHQRALGEFAVTYELNAYCDTPALMRQLYAELHRHVIDVFNEYGVQIMTPAYEGDPDEPKVVPKEQWYAEPARRPDPGTDTPRPSR